MAKGKKRGLLYKGRPGIPKYQYGTYGIGIDPATHPWNAANDQYDAGALFKNSFLKKDYGGLKAKNYYKEAAKTVSELKPIKAPDLTAQINANNDGYKQFSKQAGNLGNKNGFDFAASAATNIANAANFKSAGSGAPSAGAVQAGAQLVDMAGGALQSINDGRANTYTKKEKFGTVSGTALKGAAMGATMGSAVPGIGTAIGAAAGFVVGLVSGFVKSGKMKREAAAVQKDMNIKNESIASAENRANNANRDATLVNSAPPTSIDQGGAPVGYNRLGGTFHYTLKKYSETQINSIPLSKTPIFKRGGKVKPTENIIPNGVLHEEENSLGDKGMPVVKCDSNKCEKKYEIEKEEMILTLETTKKIEALVKEKDVKKLGEFVKDQVLHNTHSFTDKFGDLNNYTRKQANGPISA